MPILGGFVRLRKHQFGRQQLFGTAVAATRAYPFSGVPDHNPNWTQPEVDAGALAPVAPPYRVAPDVTAPLTSPSIAYNDLPLLLSGFFGGNVAPTPSGDSQTWEWDPSSTTVDPVDVYTYEFGDDVTDDWFQDKDGFLESFEITGPDGLGALTASTAWRFGSFTNTGSTDSPAVGTVPTPDLSVDTAAALVYLKDGAIFGSDTYYDLFDQQISDALHTFTARFSHETDIKRFANGTQTFDASAYGPGARQIELECTFAKTADIVGIGSETDKWMADLSVNRYVGFRFISTVVADYPDTFYSWEFAFPMRWFTRTEGEIGGNTTVVLTGRHFYDAVEFDGEFRTELVNTLTEAELGIAAS